MNYSIESALMSIFQMALPRFVSYQSLYISIAYHIDYIICVSIYFMHRFILPTKLVGKSKRDYQICLICNGILICELLVIYKISKSIAYLLFALGLIIIKIIPNLVQMQKCESTYPMFVSISNGQSISLPKYIGKIAYELPIYFLVGNDQAIHSLAKNNKIDGLVVGDMRSEQLRKLIIVFNNKTIMCARNEVISKVSIRDIVDRIDLQHGECLYDRVGILSHGVGFDKQIKTVLEHAKIKCSTFTVNSNPADFDIIIDITCINNPKIAKYTSRALELVDIISHCKLPLIVLEPHKSCFDNTIQTINTYKMLMQSYPYAYTAQIPNLIHRNLQVSHLSNGESYWCHINDISRYLKYLLSIRYTKAAKIKLPQGELISHKILISILDRLPRL